MLSVTACTYYGGGSDPLFFPPGTIAALKDEPLARGDSHSFAADYEAVVGTTREAVQEVGLEFAEDYPVNDSTQMIFCEKKLTAFRYGAVARVVVQRLGEKRVAVHVIFRRDETVELWRMEDYSRDIFAALTEKLEA